MKKPPLDEAGKEYFFTLVDKKEDNECWPWIGPKEKHTGYGYMNRGFRKKYSAHRTMFEISKYEIPENMVIDHICRNRLCVNPSHLRCVTIKVNCLENSIGITAINSVKTHCIYGHEFTPENTYIKPSTGHRRCRQCHTRQWFERKAKAQECMDRHP